MSQPQPPYGEQPAELTQTGQPANDGLPVHSEQPVYAEQPVPPPVAQQPVYPIPPQQAVPSLHASSQPVRSMPTPPAQPVRPVPSSSPVEPQSLQSSPRPAPLSRPAADPLQPNFGQPASQQQYPGGHQADPNASTGLRVPPPAPAPVMDPHPQHATDWNYTPRQTSVTSRPTPAEWGWRARLRDLSGGLLKLAPGQDELLHRAATARIRSTLPGSRTVVVANEKGGAGKTPTALILSALLAEYRREAVVAWDVNELRGTLGRRAEISEPPLTVTDVLAAAPELARPEAEVGVLSAFLRRQPEGNLVLASSEDGNAMRQIGHAECDIVRQLLLRRYGMVVCDTGNNAAAPNFLYTVDSADVVVLPTAPSDVHLEVARAMLRMLASRATTSHLVSRAVLVVTSSTGARLEPEEERWFVDRIGRVVHVPADPAIAQGGKLVIGDLSHESIKAWTQVAGAVIDAALAPSPNDRPTGRRRAPDVAQPADPPTHAAVAAAQQAAQPVSVAAAPAAPSPSAASSAAAAAPPAYPSAQPQPATPPLSAGWIPVTQPDR
jgi:MinD-like ATPase involved in chromosome partitioning or flagellar assembly